MKFFEVSGLWSLAGDTSDAIGGTFIFDNEGLNLKLLGAFSADWMAGVERYQTIYGVVERNPYGTYVTLIDCITKHSVVSRPGLTLETISCSRAIIGASHLFNEMVKFETLKVMFTYLQDWVGITGITVDVDVAGGTGYSIKYTKPELLSFSFGERRLTLAPSVKTSRGKHHAVLDEEIHILVEPVGERLPADLGGDGIQVIQNLLTFATDRPNAIEEITYYGAEDDQGLPPDYHLLFDPIFRQKEDKEPVPARDMLFTLQDCQDQKIDIFQNWLNFTEKNRPFCTVFFANLYAEPRYLNDRFASLMLAFTLLTTTTREFSERTKLFIEDVEAALKKRFGDEDRDYLRHIIPTSAEVEMPYHLLHVLQENVETMRIFIDDMPGFVKSVCDSLDYFSRREDGTTKHMQGKELLYALLKIRILIKIMVLKELGFADAVVRSLLMRNNKIGFLRTV